MSVGFTDYGQYQWMSLQSELNIDTLRFMVVKEGNEHDRVAASGQRLALCWPIIPREAE